MPVIKGITPADVAAAEAVVRDVGEMSDSIGFEEAADLRTALLTLLDATKGSLAVLETELLRQVEKQPRRYRGFTYDRKPKRSWRFHHEEIRQKTVSTILAQTGPVPGLKDALVDALDLHSDIYISPSTEAKVGGLKKIGLEKKDAGRYENKGYELDVVDTNIRDENDET